MAVLLRQLQGLPLLTKFTFSAAAAQAFGSGENVQALIDFLRVWPRVACQCDEVGFTLPSQPPERWDEV